MTNSVNKPKPQVSEATITYAVVFGALRKGETSRAERIFTKLQRVGVDEKAFHLVGDIADRLGKKRLALEMYTKAAEHEGQSASGSDHLKATYEKKAHLLLAELTLAEIQRDRAQESQGGVSAVA